MKKPKPPKKRNFYARAVRKIPPKIKPSKRKELTERHIAFYEPIKEDEK